MAKMSAGRDINPVVIGNFLGLNQSRDGSTELKLGEASECLNWRVTPGFNLVKANGYIKAVEPANDAKRVQGGITATFSGLTYFVYAAGGNVYRSRAGVNEVVGSMTDIPTSFTLFGGKVYISNGVDPIKYYDGTTFGNASDLAYAPLLAVASAPSGAGQKLEDPNLLTPKARQRFNADGTSAEYKLVLNNLDSIDKVLVGGTEISSSLYTFNLVSGTVSPSSPSTFPVGEDNVEVHFSKNHNKQNEVFMHRFCLEFAGRLYRYGGSNRVIFTGLADGVPSADYWPENAYMVFGSPDSKVNGVAASNDNLFIFKDKEAHYASPYFLTTAIGENVYTFEQKVASQDRGNRAIGQVCTVHGTPFTFMEGVYSWQMGTYATGDYGLKSKYISERVQASMDMADLSQAFTIDDVFRHEFWICVGRKVWIYNYELGVWYMRELAHTPTCLFMLEDDVCFGTTEGAIMKMDPGAMTYAGEIIEAWWTSGYMDFGTRHLIKNANKVEVSYNPAIKAGFELFFRTNNSDMWSEPYPVSCSLMDFDNWDFDDVSFEVDTSPRTDKLKMKMKKFRSIQLGIRNNKDNETAVITQLDLFVEAQ